MSQQQQMDEVAGFSCGACGKQYRWKPELAGKKVKCKCGTPISVPATPPAPGGAPKRPVPTSGQPGLAAARAGADVRGRPANVPPPPPPPPAKKPKQTED